MTMAAPCVEAKVVQAAIVTVEEHASRLPDACIRWWLRQSRGDGVLLWSVTHDSAEWCLGDFGCAPAAFSSLTASA